MKYSDTLFYFYFLKTLSGYMLNSPQQSDNQMLLQLPCRVVF